MFKASVLCTTGGFCLSKQEVMHLCKSMPIMQTVMTSSGARQGSQLGRNIYTCMSACLFVYAYPRKSLL